MRQIHRWAAAAGILALVSTSHADTILRQRQFDVTQITDPSVFTLNKAQVLALGRDDEGLTQAQLTFPGRYSSLGRKTTWFEDWSPYNILSVKLTNREAFPCEFRGLVYLGASESNTTGMFSGRIVIGPNETRRFVLYLNPDDSDPYGLKYNRPVLSAPYNNVYCSGAFRDLRTIYNWRISYQGDTPARVDVSDLRLIRQDINYTGMVDAFGQYSDRDWPTKIRANADFQQHVADEKTDLAANPSPGEQQGTSQLVNEFPVAGKWAIVTQSDGMKFLQHPNGKLLWTLGVSAVGLGTPTPVGGRESYFQALPDPSGTFSTCYIVRPTLDGDNTCYSFQQQNLILKYGSAYDAAWLSNVKQRLGSWGLNTLGMQCDGRFYDNTMPFTIILSTSNFGTRLRLPHQLWGTMPDPFDANFTAWMVTTFTKGLSAYNGKTNFMGAYVDNELSWGYLKDDKTRYNIGLGTLKAPATQPAKIAFVNWLSGRYGNSIASLNASWGTSFSSFESLLNTSWVPSTFPLPTGMAADFQGWTSMFANKYFSTVRSALVQSNLSGLYLGCRYAEYLPEVVREAEGYVDVHTFNAYRPASNFDWGFVGGLAKPYMFSEMGYSVQADGTFGGVGEVYSQKDRAQNLRDFLRTANSQPNCIGAILYCYTDQPITGRFSDYENSGLGLVDITDTPHYEAVDVLREISRSMYTNRGSVIVDPVEPPATLNPDFGLGTSSSAEEVLQGGVAAFTIGTTSLDGHSGTVALSLSGLPQGAAYAFAPSSVTSGSSSTLSITTSPSTPAGSYPLVATGTDGTISRSIALTLNVTKAAVPDFVIVAGPSSQNVKRGRTAKYTVTVSGSGGFGGSVSLSATGLGPGQDVSFSPSTISGSGTSTMAVTTTAGSARGTYLITVTGVSGGLVRSASVKLILK